MDVKWIKLYTNIFDNRKIKQIEKLPEGDGILVIWLKLLVLAGTTNDSGMVYFAKDIPYTDQMLAAEFNRPLQVIQMALNVFEKFGMIEIVNDIIMVSNWEKYQNIDGMERVREQTRLRVQKHRMKNLPCNVTSNATVTQGNATDIDIEKENKNKNIEKEKEIENKNKKREYREKSSRFSPPTIDEIKDYCVEKDYPVKVAEPFFNYYDSKGWMVGKNKMSNWHSALAGWVSREKEYRKEQNTNKIDSLFDDW